MQTINNFLYSNIAREFIISRCNLLQVKDELILFLKMKRQFLISHALVGNEYFVSE